MTDTEDIPWRPVDLPNIQAWRWGTRPPVAPPPAIITDRRAVPPKTDWYRMGTPRTLFRTKSPG